MKKINLLSIIGITSLVGLLVAGCNTTSKVQLEKVNDLVVTRNEDKWNVSFSGVENASSYSLTILKDELEIKKETLTTTSYTMDPIVETATFTFKVTALGDEKLYKESEAISTTYAVYVYDEELTNGVTLTGVAENGVPVGKFVVVYGDGARYVGTLTENYLRDNGRLTYSNNMYYEGQFVNDKFEGEGMFTWSTTGDWHDSNTYIGQFKDGGFNDQIGTYYCPAYHNRDNSYGGLIYFTGTMGPVFGVAGKTGTTGKGAFQYPNNSVYEGDLYVNGEWSYFRHGFGFNKWIVDEYSSWISGGSSTLLIDGFEGQFDKSSWVKGDGIWYFKDASGNPLSYAKGNWDGGTRLGDATSTLTLREGYENATEITF